MGIVGRNQLPVSVVHHSIAGCKNLKSIQVKYDHGVPHELVDVLTQIAKDIVKTPLGKAHYVGWLDWMRRVVGWQKKFIRRQVCLGSPSIASPA
jgi:hypothetical protein